MSIIGSMIAKETHSWVEFPGLDDFEVNLNYLNRDELSLKFVILALRLLLISILKCVKNL